MLKKEDQNNEETALSEIKIARTEEPAGRNVKKDSDNLAEEISAEDELNQDHFPDQEQDEDGGDSDPVIRKLESKNFPSENLF